MKILREELVDEEELRLFAIIWWEVFSEIRRPFQIIGRWKTLLNNLSERYFYDSIQTIKLFQQKNYSYWRKSIFSRMIFELVVIWLLLFGKPSLYTLHLNCFQLSGNTVPASVNWYPVFRFVHWLLHNQSSVPSNILTCFNCTFLAMINLIDWLPVRVKGSAGQSRLLFDEYNEEKS